MTETFTSTNLDPVVGLPVDEFYRLLRLDGVDGVDDGT